MSSPARACWSSARTSWCSAWCTRRPAPAPMPKLYGSHPSARAFARSSTADSGRSSVSSPPTVRRPSRICAKRTGWRASSPPRTNGSSSGARTCPRQKAASQEAPPSAERADQAVRADGSLGGLMMASARIGGFLKGKLVGMATRLPSRALVRIPSPRGLLRRVWTGAAFTALSPCRSRRAPALGRCGDRCSHTARSTRDRASHSSLPLGRPERLWASHAGARRAASSALMCATP